MFLITNFFCSCLVVLLSFGVCLCYQLPLWRPLLSFCFVKNNPFYFFPPENPEWLASGSCLHAPVLRSTCIPYRKPICGGGHLISGVTIVDAIKQLCGGGAPKADICPGYLKALDVGKEKWKRSAEMCPNYRGITLLSLPIKMYSRVLEKRVWLIVEPQIEAWP